MFTDLMVNTKQYCKSKNMAILLLLLLAELCLSGKSLAHLTLRVYIDGSKGNDSPECLNSNSSETPCQSLSFVSENLTQKYFVHIEILGDILNLTRAVNFTDYCNLTISGSGRSTTFHCNESDAGLAILQVQNFSLYSLTIKNCGALRPSTTSQKYLPVAVYILNCTNVSIYGVNIVSSNGTGLSIYDANGVVDIMYCNFKNNSVQNVNGSGGGGLYIEFTMCTPELTGNYCRNNSGQNDNSSYNIHHCTFIGNSVHVLQGAYNFMLPSQLVSVPRLGKGGGLYISISSDTANCGFLVKNCTFRNNNASHTAGAMIAEFLNSVKHNFVSVAQTTFEGNICMDTDFSGSGGLAIVFLLYSRSYLDGNHLHNNSFDCQFCSFKNNVGHIGGGTSVYVTKNQLSTILFSNCNWTENESVMGAAVFITPALWDYTKDGFLPVPKFKNCKFESNSAVQKFKPSMTEDNGVKVESVGFGALFVSELQVHFEGISCFYNNSGSAIHLSDSTIEFAAGSVVKFHNNTSHNGGAIAMYSSSLIQVGNSSLFSFINNRARARGGAIYSDFNAATHPAYHNCFISSSNFSPVNSTFMFQDNAANTSGDSVFTTTFEPCSLLYPNIT